MDQPTDSHWRYALDRLHEIGAVDAEQRITAHGHDLIRLPTAPRLAHMLLPAKRAGIGLLATWTAAALDTRDMSGRTDLAEVVRTLIDGRGDIAQSRRAAESARQFQRAADIAGSARPASISDADIARCVAWAYPERVALRRDGARGTHEAAFLCADGVERSEEHTSELQSLMRNSYDVF